jgi:predicted nucleic acid-binding protein
MAADSTAADRTDPYHRACADLLETSDGLLATSPLVIAEAAYLINRELGAVAEQALYTAIIDDTLIVEPLSHAGFACMSWWAATRICR